MSALAEMRAGAPLIRAMGFGGFFDRRLAGFADIWSGLNYMLKVRP